jgi:hypothetical protein
MCGRSYGHLKAPVNKCIGLPPALKISRPLLSYSLKCRKPVFRLTRLAIFSYGLEGLEAILTRMNTAKISHPRKPLMLAELPTAINSDKQLSTTI